MKNKHEVESIEVKLLKMIEQHEITEDDYNLITKYLKSEKRLKKTVAKPTVFSDAKAESDWCPPH